MENDKPILERDILDPKETGCISDIRVLYGTNDYEEIKKKIEDSRKKSRL